MRRAQWFARAKAAGDDVRGAALALVLFVMLFLTLLLLAFQSLMTGALTFGGLGRNSMVAFSLAEGGIQEALSSARLQGAILGGTSFTNSLVRAVVGSTGIVSYEACLPGTCMGSPTLFSVLSAATFAGTSRKVRILERATFKPGLGNIIVGPSLTFQADASMVSGDTYATGGGGTNDPAGVTFSSYMRSPPCATSTMGTTLLAPEVVSGTTIALGNGGGGGKRIDTHCPDGLSIDDSATYTWECASKSLTEVAPTSCLGPKNARLVPYNWHPMAPIGMPSADFAAVVEADSSARLAAGLLFEQATQDGNEVAYTSAGTYTPAYWTQAGGGPVLIILAIKPFCVNGSATSTAVLPAKTLLPTACPTGYRFYGASRAGNTPLPTRYVDWGLVQDDLSRKQATLFYQPPAIVPDVASFQCPGNSGNPCGIRYVPALPAVDIIAQTCLATQFDQVDPQDGAACMAAASTTGAVTFTGTLMAPETLVIDNSGPQANPAVRILFSARGPGLQTACDRVDFATGNAGTIFIRGNAVLVGDAAFSGYVYASGSITTQGNLTIRGGLFASVPAGQTDSLGFGGSVTSCPRQSGGLPMSPALFTFRTLSWVEVPNDQP